MYACYIVYNEEELIGDSLNSIVPYVTKVIMVDGAYEKWICNKPYSTDRTREIAERVCGTKLLWVDYDRDACKHEYRKRNVYIRLVPDGEWFISIDADEVICGEIEREFNFVTESNFRSVYVPIVNWNPKWKGSGLTIPERAWNGIEWIRNVADHARLCRKQAGYHIVNEIAVYDGDGNLVSVNEYTLRDVSMTNMKYHRRYNRYIKGVLWRHAEWNIPLPHGRSFHGTKAVRKDYSNRKT